MESDDAPRFTRDAWTRDNNLGLRWAGEGRWFEAADAFARAVALSTADFHDEPTPYASDDPEQEEAHAVLLGNLSQAQFHTGHLDDALNSAERACAIRVALLGEDAAPVARARSQVAVMLGAMGRLDDAMPMIGRALKSLEHHLADDDLALEPLLENAARLALAAGQTSVAEPHLLRLHALLAENGQPLEVVEGLLQVVAASRATPLPEPAHDHTPMLVGIAPWQLSGAHESVDVLDSVAVPLDPPANSTVGDLDVLDLDLELHEAKLVLQTAAVVPTAVVPTAVVPTAVQSSPATPDDIFGGASFDLVEAPPATLNAMPQPVPSSASQVNPLGFEVEYGVPQQPYLPTGDALPDLGHADEKIVPIEAQPRVSPLDRPTPLVLPGRNTPQRDIGSPNGQDSASLRLTLHPADVDNPDAVTRRSRHWSNGTRYGRTHAADPKRPWLIVLAVALIAILGALLYTGILARR